MTKNQPFVAVLMGSDSDYETMQATAEVLSVLKIPFEMKIKSAHRTPAETLDYVVDADARGCAVFIAAAGLAAHLAGFVAAHTLRPVIGVPMDGGPLKGMDALLSTVQMPGGVPVACTAIGRAGAKNAGYLAAQILGLHDSNVMEALRDERRANAKKIIEKDRNIQGG